MTNVNEIWKPCYNYEDYFEVSNQGRIRKKSDGKILKANKCRKGYLKIRLFVLGISILKQKFKITIVFFF